MCIYHIYFVTDIFVIWANAGLEVAKWIYLVDPV